MKLICLHIVLLALCIQSLAQSETKDSLVGTVGEEYLLGMFPKQEPPKLKQIGVSGFYRFFGTYLQMDDPYLLSEAAGVSTPERTLFIADDTQLPNLWMNVAGRPSSKTSFSMDVFMFQFLDAQVGDTYGSQLADSLKPAVYAPLGTNKLGANINLNLGINLTGSYASDFGSFTARMGGTHWYYLSDLTFASFRGYNRFTLFERNPWDPVQRSVTDRYSKFYNEGATQQDLRWGNKAFHGLILEGTSLPNDFSFSFLYGKTELNGGLGSLPNSSLGGRFRHDSKNGFESFNTFNSRTFTDSLARASIGFNVHTLEFQKSIGELKLHGEVGAGRYYAPSYTEGWGEAINLKLSTGEKWTGIPLEFHYFRIAPEVLNNNALFWNTSIEEEVNNEQPVVAGSSGVLTPFASAMIPIGLMTNNRTGLNLNTEVELGKLKLAFGYGLSSELEAISNVITYSHTVNQLTRSRFWRWDFTPEVGPYDRYNVVYRDAYESVSLTDDEGGVVVNRKHFTTAEVQAKYNTRLLNREAFFFFLGRYATVQPEFSAIIPLNEDAYIRHYSTELEFYMEISPALLWTNYAGYERVIANYATELDEESRRPRNQEGLGLGTGLDLTLGKNAVFSLRHRFFSFEDRSFSRDKASGQETLAEIKVTF